MARSIIFLLFLASCAHEKARQPASTDLPSALDSGAFSGRFQGSVMWMKDPETGEDVLHGKIEFMPALAKVSCTKIGFVQAAKVTLQDGRDYSWEMNEAPRNGIATRATAPRIIPGFYVDHLAAHCHKGSSCSPFFADHWPNGGESAFGFTKNQVAHPASLSDYPFGWALFRKIALEACAVCNDDQAIYGCVRWGGEWPEIGPATHPAPTFSASPSATFLEALRNFRSYY